MRTYTCQGIRLLQEEQCKAAEAAVARRVEQFNRQHPQLIQPIPPEAPASTLVPEIAGHQATIADTMNDPFTTRFRGVHVADGCPGCTGSGAGEVQLCGEIISKNSFGAYTGWHRFNAIFRGAELRSFGTDTDPAFLAGHYADCIRRGAIQSPS